MRSGKATYALGDEEPPILGRDSPNMGHITPHILLKHLPWVRRVDLGKEDGVIIKLARERGALALDLVKADELGRTSEGGDVLPPERGMRKRLIDSRRGGRAIEEGEGEVEEGAEDADGKAQAREDGVRGALLALDVLVVMMDLVDEVVLRRAGRGRCGYLAVCAHAKSKRRWSAERTLGDGKEGESP